jgi:hypothetical protein
MLVGACEIIVRICVRFNITNVMRRQLGGAQVATCLLDARSEYAIALLDERGGPLSVVGAELRRQLSWIAPKDIEGCSCLDAKERGVLKIESR